MATTVNLGRLANIFRGRWMLMHALAEIYKPAISRNKEKLMDVIRDICADLGKAEEAAKSELAKKMRVLKGFYTLEIAIPGGAEAAKIKSDIILINEFIKKKCYNHMTVRQAWMFFLVGLEVILWFFIGETIGKGHIVGYLV